MRRGGTRRGAFSHMTVAILYPRVDPSAPADEQDVLVQVDTVRSSLAALGHDTVDIPVTLDLEAVSRALRAAAPAAAFNLVETIDGKGSLIHLVPTLLTSMGIPFTGAPCEAIVLTSHKLLAKKILAAEGIATPRWSAAVPAGRLPMPPAWIVKSTWEHASIGLEDSAVVRTHAELAAELARRAKREPLDHLFVEEFIDGREFNLALVSADTPGAAEPESLPPAEIEFVDYPAGKPRMVGWRAKWAEGSFEYTGTPRRFDFPATDRPLIEELVRISRKCWHVFSLRGYARVDFRVDAAGRPWVLEINTNPCLAPDAGFMAAAGKAGLTIHDVVRRITADAALAKAACRD
jgi:D-alanine-D-alanine ligase